MERQRQRRRIELATATTAFQWKAGLKPGIAFPNLSQLQRYEHDTYALFSQPVFDNQRVETPTYNYKIKITKWGPSVTRFARDNVAGDTNNSNSNSNNNDSIQQPQPVITQGSLGLLNDSLSPTVKLIFELKKMVNQMSTTLQFLETEVVNKR